MPLFRGSSRFETLILSQHSRFNVACECHKEEINDDDDDGVMVKGLGVIVEGEGFGVPGLGF